MRKLIIIAALSAAGVVLAQAGGRLIVLDPTTVTPTSIRLERAQDGGVLLQATARVSQVDGGFPWDAEASCEAQDLTTAQRTCLATLNNAARICIRRTHQVPYGDGTF